MKKRLLTLLLAACLLTTAAVSTAVTASAATGDTVAGYLVKYTFQAGDTIYGLCETRKINYNTELDKIAKINNITNFNYMMPGQVLWLPSATATTDAPYYTLLAVTLEAKDTPASLCQEYGVDYNGKYNILTALNSNVTTFMAGQRFILPLYVDPTATAATPTPAPGSTGFTTPPPGSTPPPGGATLSPAGATPAPGSTKPGTAATPTPAPGLAGDTLQFYLAQHVLQSGETVSGICAAMGIDFGNQDEWIRSINGILNYNYLLPGRVILLPVSSKPSSGSYYEVMAHTVVAGDRVYNLCASYGLNYYTYETLLQRLNKRNNLATFYVGETLYMPRYVAAATNGSGSSVTGGTPLPGGVTPTPAPAGVIPTAPAGATPPSSTGSTATPNGATPPPAGTTPAPASGNPSNIPAEDKLSYLVIPHVLQSGETVSGICAELGVDFMANYDRIMQLSNIVNYNYLLPGKLILIPSTAYPKSGPYYKIMAHTLVAGDTVYNLCLTYGLNYTNNVAFLQRLNNRDDLSNFYAGQVVYMPLYVAG